MNKQIVVSAPGKIHFLGEHTVVYGKPALLAAIDKRCRITLTPRKDKNIEIVSKNFNKSVTVSALAVIEGTKLAQRSYQEYLKTGKISVLSMLTKDLLAYPIIAIGESLLFYKKRLPSGFTIEIDSEIPIGSGLGSSAAIAVSIAHAMTLFLKEEKDLENTYEIAYQTEQKKHGRPSGGDPATVLHGGLVWFRKESTDLKIIQPIKFTIPKEIAKNFYLIDTGKSVESTGEMIAKVKLLHDKKPHLIHGVFDEQENLTRQLLAALKTGNENLIMRIMSMGEKNLEKLGVVSPSVRELIQRIEKSGGVAKISGGGGVKKGTGMVLAYHKNRKALEAALQSHALLYFQTQLGVEGLKIH